MYIRKIVCVALHINDFVYRYIYIYMYIIVYIYNYRRNYLHIKINLFFTSLAIKILLHINITHWYRSIGVA